MDWPGALPGQSVDRRGGDGQRDEHGQWDEHASWPAKAARCPRAASTGVWAVQLQGRGPYAALGYACIPQLSVARACIGCERVEYRCEGQALCMGAWLPRAPESAAPEESLHSPAAPLGVTAATSHRCRAQRCAVMDQRKFCTTANGCHLTVLPAQHRISTTVRLVVGSVAAGCRSPLTPHGR